MSFASNLLKLFGVTESDGSEFKLGEWVLVDENGLRTWARVAIHSPRFNQDYYELHRIMINSQRGMITGKQDINFVPVKFGAKTYKVPNYILVAVPKGDNQGDK